jgi:predicted acetyltransferase
VNVDIRPIAEDEFEPFVRALEAAFSSHPEPDVVEMERMIAVLDRYLAAFDGPRIVGGNCSQPMTLVVPGGGRVPMSGINAVGVLPTHTRRGVSTALMRRQLDECRDRAEPLAGLYASEGAIYGRFGFGLATRDASYEIDAGDAAFVRGYEPTGVIRLVDATEAAGAFRDVLRLGPSHRVGAVGDVDRFLPWRLRDIELDEKDAPFWIVHENDDGDVDAAAAYRAKHDWPDSRPRARVTVHAFDAASAQGRADVWRYLLDVDLVGTVVASNRPVDESLFRLLREPRSARMRVGDAMWLRIVDVATAFDNRAFGGDGRVTIAVRDRFCPWNEATWAFDVDGGRAHVHHTDARAELMCQVNDLGSIYLGDATFRNMEDALQVRELERGAVERADALFGSWPAPWCWLSF